MKKDFAPYDEALELKQLGFDEPCLGFYERGKELVIQECEITDFHFDSLQCVTPTFSQAFRWFRLGYGLFAQPNKTEDREGVWYYFIIDTKRTDVCEGSFTYEEAELSCLRKLIEIVKQK